MMGRLVRPPRKDGRPRSEYYPDDLDGIQRYGNAFMLTRGTAQDNAAVDAGIEIAAHNMWRSLTEVIVREGVGEWVKLPQITVEDPPFPEVEGSLASAVPGGKVVKWAAEYWPYAKRDSWLRRAGLTEAADELAKGQP